MKIIIFLIFIIPATSLAEIFEVHSVAANESRPGTWIVKFMDGRVGFWNEESDPDLDLRKIERTVIDARLSRHLNLTDIRVVDYVKENRSTTSLEKNYQEPPYTPTVYPTYKAATKLLRGMRGDDTRDSQCYDRSHIWSFEEAQKGRFLQKVFMFFSDAYIGRYNFPWWFHTAPFALAKFNGEVLEFVIDPYFNRYPIQFKTWTDMFMRNKAQCKMIEKYSEYYTHPGEDDCYLIKTSMYFWQPQDIDAYERSGIEKKKFIDWEIKHAYRYGFGE